MINFYAVLLIAVCFGFAVYFSMNLNDVAEHVILCILCFIIWITYSYLLKEDKNMTKQKFPIQPVEDKLIVKKETVPVGERKFEVRDEDLKKTPVACQVMACGPGTETRSMPVKDGDRVLISRMAGFEVEHEGENYLLITLNDIIGVLEPVKDVQVVER